MSFFNNILTFRLNDRELNEIGEIVAKNRDKYFDESHFIRVAVMRLLRETRGGKNDIEI